MSADSRTPGQRIADLVREINAEHGIAISKIDIAWAQPGRGGRRETTDETLLRIFNGPELAITGIHFECTTTDWTAA